MLSVINAIEVATGQKLIPIETDKVERCIIYKFWQTGAINHRLELRVIDFSLMDAEFTANQIISSIGDYGDNNKIEGVASIRLNGGGVMRDNQTNTIQRVLYFDITKKE